MHYASSGMACARAGAVPQAPPTPRQSYQLTAGAAATTTAAAVTSIATATAAPAARRRRWVRVLRRQCTNRALRAPPYAAAAYGEPHRQTPPLPWPSRTLSARDPPGPCVASPTRRAARRLCLRLSRRVDHVPLSRRATSSLLAVGCASAVRSRAPDRRHSSGPLHSSGPATAHMSSVAASLRPCCARRRSCTRLGGPRARFRRAPSHRLSLTATLTNSMDSAAASIGVAPAVLKAAIVMTVGLRPARAGARRQPTRQVAAAVLWWLRCVEVEAPL